MKSTITARQKRIFEKIIEDATTDCYDEYEQISGWAALLEDNIPTPCNCIIGKERVVLEKIGTDDKGMAVIGSIKLNKAKVRALIQDIILENKTATNHINAYNS